MRYKLREGEVGNLADVLLGLAGELVRRTPPQLDPLDPLGLVAGVGHLDRLRHAPALLGLQIPARLGLQGQFVALRGVVPCVSVYVPYRMYHERNGIKYRSSYLGHCELEVDLRDGLGRVVGEGKEEADGARLGVGPVR